MSKLFKFILFSTIMSSFLFSSTIISNDAEWEIEDDYLDITIENNDVCSSLKKYEDELGIIIDEIRWYYLYNSDTNEKLGTYKIFKNKCINIDTDESVNLE